jgi:hypothetical protein
MFARVQYRNSLFCVIRNARHKVNGINAVVLENFVKTSVNPQFRITLYKFFSKIRVKIAHSESFHVRMIVPYRYECSAESQADKSDIKFFVNHEHTPKTVMMRNLLLYSR